MYISGMTEDVTTSITYCAIQNDCLKEKFISSVRLGANETAIFGIILINNVLFFSLLCSFIFVPFLELQFIIQWLSNVNMFPRSLN